MKNKVKQAGLLLVAIALCMVSIPQTSNAQISAAVTQTYSITEWYEMQSQLLSLQHELATNTSLSPDEMAKLNTMIAELQAKINNADAFLTAQNISHPAAKEASVVADNTNHITGPVDFNNPYNNIPAFVSTGDPEQDKKLLTEWMISKGLIKE